MPCAGSVDGATHTHWGARVHTAERDPADCPVLVCVATATATRSATTRRAASTRATARAPPRWTPPTTTARPAARRTGPVTASATRPETSRSAASTTATATSPRPQRRGRRRRRRCDWGARVHLPRHLPVRSLVRQRWHVRRQRPRLGVLVVRLRHRLLRLRAAMPGAAVAAGAAAAAVAAAKSGEAAVAAAVGQGRPRGVPQGALRGRGAADRPRDARARRYAAGVRQQQQEAEEVPGQEEGEEQVLLRQEMQQGGEVLPRLEVRRVPGALQGDRADVDVVHEGMRVGNGGSAPTSICCEKSGGRRGGSARKPYHAGIIIREKEQARHSATGSGALAGGQGGTFTPLLRVLNSQRADE